MWGDTGYRSYGGGSPGIFGNILKGLDAIINVTQAYQGYQAKKQHLEAGEREAALAPLKLQQFISPGEPVTPTPEVAERAGKAFGTPWPKVTEEGRVKTMGEYWQSIAKQGTVDERGRAITSPTEPEQQARIAGATRTLATMGQAGGYKPIMPQTQPVYSTAGGVLSRLGELPSHAKIVESDKNFTTLIDETGKVLGRVSGKAMQPKKYETPVEKLEREKKKLDYQQGLKKDLEDYKSTEPDPEGTGLRVPKDKNKLVGLAGNIEVIAKKYNLDVWNNPEHYKKAIAFATGGKMSEEAKQLNQMHRDAWKEWDKKVGGDEPTRGEWIKTRVKEKASLMDQGIKPSSKPTIQNPLESIKEGEVKTIGDKKYTRQNGVLGVLE